MQEDHTHTDSHHETPTARIAPILFFSIVVIVGIWLISQASAIIANTPRDGSVLDASAITLWSTNRGTNDQRDESGVSHSGITVQSSNYPPQTTLQKRSDLTIGEVSVSQKDKLTVSFTVQNIGETFARNWQVQVTLPDNTVIYASPRQKDLMAGTQRTFTLSFTDSSVPESLSITVDPHNMIDEHVEENNETIVMLQRS